MVALAGIDAERGLRTHDATRTTPGYVMFSPLVSDTTYLVDRNGQVVHFWSSEYAAGSEYLLDDGSLLRAFSIL